MKIRTTNKNEPVWFESTNLTPNCSTYPNEPVEDNPPLTELRTSRLSYDSFDHRLLEVCFLVLVPIPKLPSINVFFCSSTLPKEPVEVIEPVISLKTNVSFPNDDVELLFKYNLNFLQYCL